MRPRSIRSRSTPPRFLGAGRAKPRKLYTVTFAESGLPNGTAWAVTLEGSVVRTSTDEVTASEPNGTLSYSISGRPRLASVDPAVLGQPHGERRAGLRAESPVRPGDVLGDVHRNGTAGRRLLERGVGRVPAPSTTDSLLFTEPNGSYTFTGGPVATARSIGAWSRSTFRGSPSPCRSFHLQSNDLSHVLGSSRQRRLCPGRRSNGGSVGRRLVVGTLLRVSSREGSLEFLRVPARCLVLRPRRSSTHARPRTRSRPWAPQRCREPRWNAAWIPIGAHGGFERVGETHQLHSPVPLVPSLEPPPPAKLSF